MATTLPLTIIPDPDGAGSASVFVDVEIDGRRVPFLLDTGAAGSRTSGGPPTTDGGPPQRVTPSGGALGGDARQMRRAMVETLIWGTGDGALTVHGIEMEAADDDLPGPAHILGLDVLAAHRLDVIYSAHLLVVDGEGRAPLTTPLLLSSHRHPHVELDWNGLKVCALLDTGASVSLVDSAFAAAHPSIVAVHGRDNGTDAYGTTTETQMATLAGPRIGGRAFRRSLAAIAPIRGIQPAGDPEFDVILGHPLLAQADWSLDLPGRRWSFVDELGADEALIE